MSIERTPPHQDPVVIVSALRTPMGGFQGDLQSLSATALGSIAIRAAVERAGIEPADVEHVLFGCVLPAGLGQAPARQAALGAGLSHATLCSTVNKMLTEIGAASLRGCKDALAEQREVTRCVAARGNTGPVRSACPQRPASWKSAGQGSSGP